jgi:type II secretory pathway pseudopilin PulG
MNRHGQHGYAMAALIVAMSIMAILLTAVMPVWRQTIRREKEAELEFRLGQYARAIALFQRKAGPGVLAPDLDVLIDQKYLRKKYKDPITGGDFDILRVNSANSSGGQQQGAGQRPGQGAGNTIGGIMGVASKSTELSLKLFNGRSHYNEWQSQLIVQRSNVAGMGANGTPGVGGGAGGTGNGRGSNQNPQGGGIGGSGTGGRSGSGTGTGGGRQGGGANAPQGQRGQGGGGFQFPPVGGGRR